jgi:hypothetical protein
VKSGTMVDHRYYVWNIVSTPTFTIMAMVRNVEAIPDKFNITYNMHLSNSFSQNQITIRVLLILMIVLD